MTQTRKTTPRAGLPKASPELAVRRIAARVIARVCDDDAYAVRVLDAELNRNKLESSERALVTQLVYGALRTMPQIDAYLTRFLTKPIADLEPWTRAVLRSSIHQLAVMQEAEHAVVHQAVSLTREVRGETMAKLTNAVLRKALKHLDRDDPAWQQLHLPDWLNKQMSALGSDRLSTFVQLPKQSPALNLCVNETKTTTAELIKRLRAELRDTAQIEPHPTLSDMIVVRRAGDMRRTGCYNEGLFYLQESGARCVAELLDAQPEHHIADVCAGHGGKTLWLLQRLNPGAAITAIDLYQKKLEALEQHVTRLGLNLRDKVASLTTETIDMSVGTGGLDAHFDRVLVDAPCSGSGTLRRRPEILQRLKPEDLERLRTLQVAILINAWRLVKPGGRLLYAVCSLSQAEGPESVALFSRDTSDATRISLAASRLAITLGLQDDADTMLRLGAWVHPDMDGFQLAAWQKHRGH